MSFINKFKLKYMMEPDIKLSKPIFSKSSPLSCFLCDAPSSLSPTESRLIGLFHRSQALKAKYATLQDLWNHLLAVRPSRCGGHLAGITEDSHLVIFDLCKDRVYFMYMPVMEGMLLCTVAVSSHVAIIGGVHQALSVNFEKGLITALDFSSNVRFLTISTKPERQRKLATSWKELTKIPRTDYSGDFHEISTSAGVAVKGFIGILYTKEQFAAATKRTKTERENEEEEGKANLDTEAARYVLHLTKISYADHEDVLIAQKSMNVEYSVNPCAQPLREAYLIVRTDSRCEMGAVALNSSHKYYCQLLLMSTNSTTCMHLRPINFISSNDILPTDKYGRTSMLISDISWTPNDQFVVVFFCANYYCVLSRLGQPLNLLYRGPLVHFSALSPERPGEKIEDGAYPNLRTTDKSIFLFGDTGSAVIEYESRVPLLELWRVDQMSSKVNKIFRLILSFPELGVNAAALERLEKALDNEVVYFSPQKRSSYESFKQNQMEQNPDFIQFKNPFPLEPTVDVGQIVNGGLLLIEATRWSTNITNNLLELVQDELENLCRLLYLKNEPIYFLHIMQMYKKFVQKQLSASIMENVKLYGLPAIHKTVVESQGVILNFDKKKALLMFYCLIQFRNFKATNFNILYLVTAGLLRNRWGNHKIFSEVLNSIITMLKSNLSSEKGKKQDFFETELKTSLNDKGALYQSMFSLCEKAYPENNPQLSPQDKCEDKDPGQIDPLGNELDDDSKGGSAEKPKHALSLADSLMKFYETDKLAKLFAIIAGGGKEEEIKEIINTKESYIGYLYSCAELIKNGKFNTALKNIQELLNIAIAPEALLKPENKIERPLIFIIVFSCLSLVSLALLGKEQKYTIDLCEVPTFLYRILSEEDLIKTFNQLKKSVVESETECGMLHTLVSSCSNKQREVYSAIGVLLQLSAHKTAINLLLDRPDSSDALLGLLVLNNQLNASISYGKEQLSKEYINILVQSVNTLLKRYPLSLIRLLLDKAKTKASLTRNLFSTCVALSGKLTGTVITYLALPSLASHLNALLHTANILPEQMVKLGCKSFPVQPCPFLGKLAKTLCGCSVDACQRVFAGAFLDPTRATTFNYLLQEAVQLLAVAIRANIIEPFPTTKGELLKISKFVPPKTAEEIKAGITKLLQLIWELSLLFSIESFKNGESLSSVNKLRLAGYMIRYSALGASEQQELQFIQQGLSLLKTVNYGEVKLPMDNEVVQDLGNALEIYAEKWEAIIKSEKATILTIIKNANPSVYKVLANYMTRRKHAVRTHVLPKTTQCFDSDVVFCRMLGCLKQIFDWMLQKDSPLSASVEQGEEVRTSLRKTLEGIDGITGIPKTMVLEKDNCKWSLKSALTFHKANDDLNEEPKILSILEEVLEKAKPDQKEYVTEDVDKYHYAVAGSIIGTWRVGSKAGYTTALQIVKNNHTGTINSKRLGRKAAQKLTAPNHSVEDLLKCEKAVGNIVSVLSKSLSTILKEIKTSRLSFALKKNVRPLVPGRVRSCHHKKSLSLVTQESEGVKPFALYSIKRDHLATSTVNTRANNTPRDQTNIHARMATEENKSNKFTDASLHSVFLVSGNRWLAIPEPKTEKVRKKKKDLILGADIQIKIEKINKEYEKIKADSTKAKVHFLDRIKQQILSSKKKP